MSSDNSPERGAEVQQRDSAGYEWEEVGVGGENLLPPPRKAPVQVRVKGERCSVSV